jgi:choline transporter-like protein 2/4/5
MWIAMTIVGFASLGFIKVPYLKEGDPELLLHGVDYEGNICGVDGIVQSLPLRIMPNFYLTTASSTGDYIPPLLAVCVASCPSNGGLITDPYGTYGTWSAAYDSKDFLNNCLYVSEDRDNTSATTILSDFARAAGVIALLGFALALVCSFLFLLVTRIPLFLRSIVWFCVGFILIVLAGGGYFLLNEAKEQEHTQDSSSMQTKTEIALLKALGGILSGFAVLWLCVICFMRKRIALAISLIRESAHALTSMPLLALLPFLQTMFFAGFTALWMFYCVYLVSSGDIDTVTDSITGFSFKTISYDRYCQRAILFMFFAWLWSIGFLEAIGQIGSSHAVLTWYFADIRYEIDSRQVLSSMCLVTWFHSGTAAVGSFLIATLRLLRMMLEYVKYRLAVMNKIEQRGTNAVTATVAGTVSGTGRCVYNTCTSIRYRLISCILCSLSCLLLLFEKIIKFLNKHSYIQCAMMGSAFFPSAMKAYRILFRNLGRLAAVSVVGDFVVLIGKLSITLSSAGLGYWYMSHFMKDSLNGFVLPTIFIAFLAFVTATMFLGVLSATADSLLQACIVDEERELLLGKSQKQGKNNGENSDEEEGHEETKEDTHPDTAKARSQKHQGLRDLVINHAEDWRCAEEVNEAEEHELESLRVSQSGLMEEYVIQAGVTEVEEHYHDTASPIVQQPTLADHRITVPPSVPSRPPRNNNNQTNVSRSVEMTPISSSSATSASSMGKTSTTGAAASASWVLPGARTNRYRTSHTEKIQTSLVERSSNPFIDENRL